MGEKGDAFARFDVMGRGQVEKQVLMWDQIEQRYAFEWMEVRSSEERVLNDAAQAEQLALARSAADNADRALAEARIANAIAARSKTIAIIGSAISIAIAILSWLLPR